MLYKAGGKIYIGDRSKKNAKKAIRSIKLSAARSATTGQLEYLFLDLQDLTMIKPAVESFKKKKLSSTSFGIMPVSRCLH